MLLLLAPAAALLAAVLVTTGTPSDLDPVVERNTAFVSSFDDDSAIDVTIALEQSVPPKLTAPTWTGVVGALFFDFGDTLTSGQSIAMVGGSVVTVIHSETPFSRTLSVGAQGSDVTVLQYLLKGSGYYVGESSGRYDSATAKAVRAWRTAIGDVAPTEIFDPATVIWLPEPTFVVGATTLVVGAPAPPAGDGVLSGPGQYATSILNSGDRTILDPIPSGYQLVTDNTSLGKLEVGGLDARQIERIVRIAVESNESAKSPAPDDVAGPPPLEVSAVLRLDTPVRRSVVPAGSVVTDPLDGVVCLFVVSADTQVPFRTSVIGGDLGVVFIDPAPSDGTEIVTNPLVVAPRQSC